MLSDEPMTLGELLGEQPADALALLTPGRAGMNFRGLLSVAAMADRDLAAAGIGRRARIATVLRNGPEAACSFLALGCRGAVAPLNPGLTKAEIAFALGDVGPSLLLTDAEPDSPAWNAARELGMPVAQLAGDASQPAGWFRIRGLPAGSIPPSNAAVEPGDELLLLHTSGTTARPKLVPITQSAFCLSAQSVAASLNLSARDVSLNVMPLFHVHGLVASLAASLSAGGGVWCSPGFSALHFRRWLEESGATWYSAVPSMHQAVLNRAMRGDDALPAHNLRLIRSCSAPLMEATWRELESVFRAPVVQAYGMTEAAHQVSSTRPDSPLGPLSGVGQSRDLEVRILDENGIVMPPGCEGEVALAGPTILKGYLSPPGADLPSFRDGFFLTGDIGRIDRSGNLHLTGRRKEMINCGGEKISPYEIEEALLAQPGVQQSLAFPAPHPVLGEEPAAAIVCAPGGEVNLAEIRAALASRLSARKRPRRYWVLASIPVGPTGKPQRARMAELLAAAGIEPVKAAKDGS